MNLLFNSGCPLNQVAAKPEIATNTFKSWRNRSRGTGSADKAAANSREGEKRRFADCGVKQSICAAT